MDYELTQEDTSEIQILNAKMVSLKNLVKETMLEGNSLVTERLTTELAKTQIEYDGWFDRMQTKFAVSTRPDQHWNVDFKARKLQLLG